MNSKQLKENKLTLNRMVASAVPDSIWGPSPQQMNNYWSMLKKTQKEDSCPAQANPVVPKSAFSDFDFLGRDIVPGESRINVPFNKRMSKAETKKDIKRMSKAEITKEIKEESTSDDSYQISRAGCASAKKRRGRKRERDDVYFVKGNARIMGMRLQLESESG